MNAKQQSEYDQGFHDGKNSTFSSEIGGAIIEGLSLGLTSPGEVYEAGKAAGKSAQASEA